MTRSARSGTSAASPPRADLCEKKRWPAHCSRGASMIRVLRACAFSLTLVGPIAAVALVDCGGRSVLLEPEPGTEPQPAPSGDAAPDLDVGITTDAPIRRDTGPGKEAGPTCPPPSTVNSGFACAARGLKCLSSSFDNDCNGQPTIPVACICGQSMWNCVHMRPACPPAPMCPAPSTIKNGASCAVDGLTCQSDLPIYGCGGLVSGYAQCQCTQGGQWFCQFPQQPVGLCVDASMPPSTCPDPSALMEGTACSSNGLTCKGNPTLCGGATFFDAFQCDGSKFVTVAMTICGIDGGADAATD
jgi:hypothetical protein